MNKVVPFAGVPNPDSSTLLTPRLPDLLDQIVAFLRRYVVFPSNEQPIAIALWIAHTWVVSAFEFTPYLSIGSPVKRCGKSTLLECLARLCRAPWQAVSPTPAVLYRKIQANCPTLLLDEVDTIFTASKGDDGKEALRALLNAGFQRSAKVPRCDGPRHDLVEFSVFCPKALAGIGTLPDTVADRSIPITLARSAPGQKAARFRSREVAPLADELRDALESWSQSPAVLSTLEASRPDIPESLGERAADICEPLLAIADLAGGTWPEKGRAAVVRLCGTRTDDDDLGAKLLKAIRTVFAEAKVERLATRDVLKKLVQQEDDGPWASWWEADLGRGNTRGPAAKLAHLLKPFGVFPRALRDADGELVKGYMRDAFTDAFARYLSKDP